VPAGILDDLRRFVGGQVILLNLYHELEDKLITRDVAKEYLSRASGLLYSRSRKKRRTVDDILFQAWSAVWDTPLEFQLLGPICEYSDRVAVVLRSYSQISYLLRMELESAPDRLELLAKTEKSSGAITKVECEGLARLISTLDPKEYDLFLTARIKGGSANRYIVWMSNVEITELENLPDDDRATQLRNWLGLGHFTKDEPIFAFISVDPHRALMKRCNGAVRRPTIWDAINQPWFRSRRDRIHYADDWARAIDLKKVGGGRADELDGGPEAVSESLKIPANFWCLFVGRARDTMPKPNNRFVAMLLDGKTMDQVRNDLVAKLV